MNDHNDTSLPPELESALAQELEAMTAPMNTESTQQNQPQLWKNALAQHRAESRAASRASVALSLLRSQWATGIASAAATLAITLTIFVLLPGSNESPDQTARLISPGSSSGSASDTRATGSREPQNLFNQIASPPPGYDGTTPLAQQEAFAQAQKAHDDEVETEALSANRSAARGTENPGMRSAGAAAFAPALEINEELAPADTALADAVASNNFTIFDTPEAGGVIGLGPNAKLRAREIIKTVRIDIRVDELQNAYAEARSITRPELGEYIESGSHEAIATATAPDEAQITLRLHAADLEAQLIRLREIGHVLFESASADDVSAQRSELLGQLRDQRRAETRLQSAIEQNTGSTDTLAELERIREDIGRTDEALDHLDNLAEHSTVLVTFRR